MLLSPLADTHVPSTFSFPFTSKTPGTRHQTRWVLPSRHAYIPREVIPGSAGIFLHVASEENPKALYVWEISDTGCD